MNFYQQIEHELESNGIQIFGRHDYNEETFKTEPDMTELIFGVYIENQRGETWDLQWDELGETWIANPMESEDLERESGKTIQEIIKLLK